MSGFRNSLLKACVTGELDYSKWRGVFIEDVNGDLWNIDDWDGSVTPNGVAVLTDDCRFVVALEDASEGSNWAVTGTIPNITTTSDINVAKNDFDGKTQTAQMYAYGARYAYSAKLCLEYVFPNGQNGYLGAAGEWQAVKDNFTTVINAIEKCGYSYSIQYWTSTQSSEDSAWVIGIDYQGLFSYVKTNPFCVRAFTTLKSETV